MILLHFKILNLALTRILAFFNFQFQHCYLEISGGVGGGVEVIPCAIQKVKGLIPHIT